MSPPPSGIGARIFVKEEGGEHLFVEISRSARRVRVARGKVGGRHRIQERRAKSEAFAEEFVAEEIHALVREGYVEATGEFVRPDEPDDPSADAEEAARKLMRQAFVPRLAAGLGTSLQIGGAPLLAPGEPWPACAGCRVPMYHLFQLWVTELPRPTQSVLGDGDDLVQLFHAHCECEASGPYSPAHLARRIPASAPLVATAGPTEVQTTGKRLFDWTPTLELPHHFEFDELYETEDNRVADILRERSEKCMSGEKLLGWPHWMQSTSYSRCRICHTQMSFVFQIESHRELPVQFGGFGVGYLFVCRQHPNVLAFVWQRR